MGPATPIEVARGKQRDEAMSRYLQHRVREQLKKMNERTFAGRVGLSPAAINGIKNEAKGVGYGVIESFAKFFKVEAPELHRLAAEWARRNPLPEEQTPAPGSVVVRATDGTTATPAFDDAARFLAQRVSPATVETVRREAQENDAAQDQIGWMRRLIDVQVEKSEEASRDFQVVEEAFKPPK